MSAGRLLVESYLKKQACGYHQFARLVVAFHPDLGGDHCLVEDDDFLPELREGAFSGLAKARQELGLEAGAVIGQAWTHPVDSHRYDFETCAYDCARKHLAEPALRPAPLISEPLELLEFWRAENRLVRDTIRAELAVTLPQLGYQPVSPDRWSRARGCRSDIIFLFDSSSLSATVDVGFAHRVPQVLEQDFQGAWLSNLSGVVGGWPLEAHDPAGNIRSAFQEEMRRREATSEEEVWRSWLLPERRLVSSLKAVALRELGEFAAAREVVLSRLEETGSGPEREILMALLASLEV